MTKKILMLSPTPIRPLNFGNRIRISRVVKSFIERGCLVDFIYYPSESDWRRDIPEDKLNEMQAIVNNFFIVPPTRGLHTNSIGVDHKIDEWWDDSIGQFLTWLFNLKKYDIFYVNYTWLSKAFEYCPKKTLKVLDTHDKFSGRRVELNKLHINPEFFHTTDNEEKIGLDRADLVLAIKKQEQHYFKNITNAETLTLIHADNLNFRAPALNKKNVKFGIFAAQNNINKKNIEKFLYETKCYFIHMSEILSIDIYGSICTELNVSMYPWVNLKGYVEKQDDFYNNVDVVLVPMEISTGLKIKSAEALSYGLPIIANRHAFEGLPAFHNAMKCKDSKQIFHEILSYLNDEENYRAKLIAGVKLSAKFALMDYNASIEKIIY